MITIIEHFAIQFIDRTEGMNPLENIFVPRRGLPSEAGSSSTMSEEPDFEEFFITETIRLRGFILRCSGAKPILVKSTLFARPRLRVTPVIDERTVPVAIVPDHFSPLQT